VIIVTGGCGFIGSNFVLQWFEQCSEPVLVLDKLTYASNLENLESVSKNSNFSLHRADIADKEIVSSLLRKLKPRAVINFAAESHVDRSIHGPSDFIKTNIVGTFNLLESCREYWMSCDIETAAEFRFIHVSTDEVYGSLSPNEPAFSETTSFKPNSPYSASKAASDHLIRAWFHTYDFPAITTNCSNNYGPFHFPEKLIPLVIINALESKNIPIYGDGLQIRDWLYVRDHCKAIMRVLDGGRIGETYNIGGRSEKTNLEIVHTICSLLDQFSPQNNGESYSRQITHVKDRPGHDRRYAVDTLKIQSELSWQPQESFESGIEKTVRWYIENPKWVNNVKSGSYRDWINLQYE
jgi:dTDP-glucose 4,6-dehydratase